MSDDVSSATAASRKSLKPLADGPPEIVTESPFPQYAYGMLMATRLASALGVDRISVLELGVAGGNGLLEMERLAVVLENYYGVALDVFGFDLETGMPPPLDYRDSPYAWQGGFFRMDQEALRKRLMRAELLLGDIGDTGPPFLASLSSPIGFVSFDLDYYSSTLAAFGALLTGSEERYLPRVLSYFDDTVGPHDELHSEFTGELLAISEFNATHADRKIAKINGLAAKLHPMVGQWIEGIHVAHLFDHRMYSRYVYPEADRQFPLEWKSDAAE